MINIFLIDDHPLILEGLKKILQDDPGFNITGTAQTSDQALASLRENPSPHIILLDLNLGEEDWLLLYHQLKKEFSMMKIIIISSTGDGQIILKAMRVGANGYILKTSGLRELKEAIHKVMLGETYICREASAAMINALQNDRSSTKEIASLTRREREILNLLDKGYTSSEVADMLHLSIHTIDTHRKNMLQKFKVHNTQGLLHFVNQHRLLN